MRRARTRTRHADPATIAASISPDNTDEMDMRVEDDAVVTVIERETTGGLGSTLDDYLVNLGVADDVIRLAREGTDDEQRTNETDDTRP